MYTITKFIQPINGMNSQMTFPFIICFFRWAITTIAPIWSYRFFQGSSLQQ